MIIKPGELFCSFCMFDENVPEDAEGLDIIVIMNGHSTCMHHCGYCQGGEWTMVLAFLKHRDVRPESPAPRMPPGHPRAGPPPGKYDQMMRRDEPHDAAVPEPGPSRGRRHRK